jgi:CBS domain-containing protein
MIATSHPKPVSPEVLAGTLSRRLPFDRMEGDHVRWLAERLDRTIYAPGSAILSAGAAPDRLHFIWSGAVQLEAIGDVETDRRVLAELVDGECFPIEALHERRPIFSTFRATSETLCYELPLESFLALQEMSPAFRGFCEQRSRSFLDGSRRIYQAHFARSPDEPSLASPLSLLMRPPAATCGPETRLRDALAAMRRSGADAVVVLSPEQSPVGVFGLDDLLERVAAALDLDAPMAECMAPPPAILSPDDLGSEAALAMARHGHRQVLVTDRGRLAGVVPERSLFSLQRVGVGEIGRAIQRGKDAGALAHAAREIQVLAHNLMAQGVAAAQLTRLVSTLNDRLTERVVALEAERAGLRGIDFCWIALGSEGRMEQTLCTDQDNGIIFAAGDANPEEVRAALLPVAQRINEALAGCGFPLCKGSVMAGNPAWCLSTAEWLARFEAWTGTPSPQALLNACIFFDLRAVYGDRELARELSDFIAQAAPRSPIFLAALASNALERTAPIGFFRDFAVDAAADPPGTVDLKLAGTALFVDAARALALAHGISIPATERRLREAGDRMNASRGEIEAAVEAFHFVQVLRLRLQYELGQTGRPMHNRVNPYELNPLDRRFFLEALRQATRLQKHVAWMKRSITGG